MTVDARARAAAVLAAGLNRARGVVDASVEEALAILAECAGASDQVDAVDQPKWITIGEAANIRKCSIETMTKHVVAEGLGVKTAGRWRVDRVRVLAWHEGRPFDPLDPYPDRQDR